MGASIPSCGVELRLVARERPGFRAVAGFAGFGACGWLSEGLRSVVVAQGVHQ